jgi:endonuclease/exonuclease/phosphatase family metal-dependent hydrolase
MDKDDKEMGELYDINEGIIEEGGEGERNTIIMGDGNSVFGVKSYRNVIGPRGLRRRNRRLQMFVDFGKEMDTNAWFKRYKRKLYSWKVPEDQNGRQFDYILVKQQFGSSVKDVQTLPGADI